MVEVNLTNVQSKRSNQENDEDGSHGSKKEQKVIQRDSSPKKGQNQRQGNDVTHLILPNLVPHLDEEKREVRSEAKRGDREEPLVRLRLYRLLIP